MKNTTYKTLALATATVAIAALTGCFTPKTQLSPTDNPNPKSWIVMQTNEHDAVLQPAAAGTAPESTDMKARVILVDRSYRLLEVMYEDGHTQSFKIPLPDTMDTVTRGDNVLVRPGSVPVSKGA